MTSKIIFPDYKSPNTILLLSLFTGSQLHMTYSILSTMFEVLHEVALASLTLHCPCGALLSAHVDSEEGLHKTTHAWPTQELSNFTGPAPFPKQEYRLSLTNTSKRIRKSKIFCGFCHFSMLAQIHLNTVQSRKIPLVAHGSS